MAENHDSNECLIVGAGPAGLAPLIAAANAGKLRDLLDAGVTIIERGDSIGAGEIGNYAISSDSAAEAFLDAIVKSKEPRLEDLRHHPICQLIAKSIGGAIPLVLVGEFLHLVGMRLCELVVTSSRGQVLLQHSAISTSQTRSGPSRWVTCVKCEVTGHERHIYSSSVVLATGAHQPTSRLKTEQVAGIPLLPTYAGKLLQSGYVLSHDGLKDIVHRLSLKDDPKVVVVGGSTSAGAVTRVLLSDEASIRFGMKSVTLMHRKPLRIFYSSVAEALQDGYTDFGPDDICAVSGRVYRLAGFRLETRELMMRVMRIAGREDEPRLNLHMLEGENLKTTESLLDEADVIVAAMGYRPRALPVFDESGRAIVLQASSDRILPLVNNDSNVVDERGQPIDGLYGIGLASGFVPTGSFGGEKSFKGQSNSLWLWQHAIGEQIVDRVLHKRMSRVELLAPNMNLVPLPA
jgi:hypothetical protein